MRLSPDSRRLAVVVRTLSEAGLWLYDLERGNLTPVNREGESSFPLWSPDGRRLAFTWLNAGRPSIATQPADGSAAPTEHVTGPFVPSSFFHDGRQIAAVTPQTTVNLDIVMVNLGDREGRHPTAGRDTKSGTVARAVGRRALARVRVERVGPRRNLRSAVPGAWPGAARIGRWRSESAWHHNGRELFFLGPRDEAGKRWMMAVEFSPGVKEPRIGRPRPLFPFDPGELLFGGDPLRAYDVSPDGLRFYAARQSTRSSPPVVTHINLILNWFEELKAKVALK